MRLSVQKLRWLLIVGAVFLVVVLAGYIGYGRYKAHLQLLKILTRAGISLTHDTDNFTYSQSVQGRTIFTLHAKKATPLGDGKYRLHGAELTLYGRVEGGADTITGDEIEYDEKSGLAKADGEVHMDLQAPHALAGHGVSYTAESGHENADVIHVLTHGLQYIRKLGLATTDQEVEIRYGGMECTAMGAEFNSDQSTLHLLANVHMTGVVHGAPMTLTASAADMDRATNLANLTQPLVQSQGRSGRADLAVATLRTDGSVESALATGRVVITSGTQQVTAARLDATFGDTSQPQTAKLSGGVAMLDVSTVKPAKGSASVVDAFFDAHGQPVKVVGSGGARVSMVDYKGSAQGLRREMSGETITATLASTAGRSAAAAKSRMRLTELHLTGGAKAMGDSLSRPAEKPGAHGAELKSTQVAADDLRAIFGESASGSTQLQKVLGAGHTMLEQDAPLEAEQTSSGDSLEILFSTVSGEEAAKILSATQNGHVVIHSRAAAKAVVAKNGAKPTAPAVTTANADHAVYEGSTERLVLTGSAHVTDGSTSLTADSVTLDQRSGDATAQGSVMAALESTPGVGATTATQITHITAASARLQNASKLAEFHGTDAQPARLWQGASQVEAANLFFDSDKRTLAARPTAAGTMIHAVFAGQGTVARQEDSSKKPQHKGGAANVVRVTSQRMDYNDLQREAVFGGAVQIDGTMGDVHGQRAVVLLNPAAKQPVQSQGATPPTPFSGSLDKVVITGDVRLEQPERHGTGEQLVYTSATDTYLLTGTAEKPPKIVDAKQGSVTGSTLLFSDAGSTIIVTGDPAAVKADPAKPKVRVRTETEVKK